MIKELSEADLKVCRIQGEIFASSVDFIECGSASFIRNFMHSDIATHIDSSNIIYESLSEKRIINEYIKQYGNKKYGKVKFDPKAMYWIGYLYRFWNISYGTTSRMIYKTINGKELYSLYEPYHTFSIEKAIKRILESKNVPNNDEERLVQTMRGILL